jgi:hypothetical protein
VISHPGKRTQPGRLHAGAARHRRSSFRSSRPGAIAVDDTHVWMANNTANFITELYSANGSFLKICHPFRTKCVPYEVGNRLIVFHGQSAPRRNLYLLDVSKCQPGGCTLCA